MEMLVSGLGDMLAKYISIAEWRISHLITGEYYCETVADEVRSALKRCVDNADGLLRREDEAVEAVFEGLVTAGAAMAYAGASRPASGIEHYISHLWDMQGVGSGKKTSTHGIQCAVGTLIAARLYEGLLSVKPDPAKGLAYAAAFDTDAWSEELRDLLGKGAEDMIALERTEGKYDTAKHAARIAIISDKWEEIAAIIREEIPSAAEIDELLTKLGCPKTPEAWGGSAEDLPMIVKATKDIRDKYILSRLAFDLGILDELAETVRPLRSHINFEKGRIVP
jgi:glycerol-1-phosphate dehydrogenase [NAD(P)+]